MTCTSPEIFEGLKAYRQPDGSVATFRPDKNARRFQASARRLGMPELPVETFIEACDVLVQQDCAWVPAHGGEEFLYLRPFMIATEVGLGVKPANEYLFLVIASPAGACFRRRQARLHLGLRGPRPRRPRRHGRRQDRRQLRGLPPRPGRGRRAGLRPGLLDAVEHKWIEELGGMNLYFVYGDRSVAPPSPAPSWRASPATPSSPSPRPRLHLRGGPRLHRPVAARRGERHPDRGLRLRHGRGHHPRRHGQAHRCRVAAVRR